jgi:hypothetical protein
MENSPIEHKNQPPKRNHQRRIYQWKINTLNTKCLGNATPKKEIKYEEFNHSTKK